MVRRWSWAAVHGEGDTGARPTARLDWDKNKPDPSNRAPDWLQAGGNKLEKKKIAIHGHANGIQSGGGGISKRNCEIQL